MKKNRRAKIVATIGPASESEEMLRSLILAGMNVARLNFSHGTHTEHLAKIRCIRKLSKELGIPVAILQDLPGPKMRVGKLDDKGIMLDVGTIVTLAATETLQDTPDKANPVPGAFIPLDVPGFAKSVREGNRILLDDGNLELEVISTDGVTVLAKVVVGGKLTSHKGVNLPGAELLFPNITEKDKRDLSFGLKHSVDYVAVSFVRSKEDVEEIRACIAQETGDPNFARVIAKLERPEAIKNLHELIHASDGVMVARGDLGIETSASAVPILQKEIINLANLHGRLVITATEMLDSMINNPRPTRAEASDVANAIFDGTDAVMLSGETASGSFPLEAVQMMSRIVLEAELNADKYGHGIRDPQDDDLDDAYSLTSAANALAQDSDVEAIAVYSMSGKTAQIMSKLRPNVPVFGISPDQRAYHRMALYWGITPIHGKFAHSVEEMISQVDSILDEKTSLNPGQQVVMIAGYPIGSSKPPALALLHTIGGESER